MAPTTHFLGNCRIYDHDLKLLRALPHGHLCLPLDDGSYLSSSLTALTRYSPEGERLWAIPGHYHHQLRLDGDAFLALKEEIHRFGEVSYKYDVVERRRHGDGGLIARFSFRDHADQLKKHSRPRGLAVALPTSESAWRPEAGDLEFTHANAIDVIPPGLRAHYGDGHYLVTDALTLTCLVLDETLQRITHSFSPDFGEYRFTFMHDCQPEGKGGWLVYHNRYGANQTDSFFEVWRFNAAGKGEIVFPRRERDRVDATFSGGVHHLPDGRYVFVGTRSDSAVLGFFDEAGEILRQVRVPHMVQDLKARNLSRFLSLNGLR